MAMAVAGILIAVSAEGGHAIALRQNGNPAFVSIREWQSDISAFGSCIELKGADNWAGRDGGRSASPKENTMKEKHEFLAPSHLPVEKESHGAVAVALEAVNPGPLVGNWVNSDPGTRDIVKITIALKAPEITVHAWGACSPTPCDWGTVPGMVYASSVSSTPAMAFTAAYKFGFAQVTMVAHIEGNRLILENFTHFTDNSGRADYYFKNIMHK
jgi:hypothetical protein